MSINSYKSPDFLVKYWPRQKKELSEAKNIIYNKDWLLQKEGDDFKTYYRTVKDSPFHMFNGVVNVKNTTPQEFFDFFFSHTKKGDIETIQKCAPRTKECEILKEFKLDRFYVMKIVISTNSRLVADREFLCTRVIEKTESRISILTQSIDEEDEKLFPVTNEEGSGKNVRGKMYYHIEILKDGNDIVIYNILHNDPKGAVPVVLVNKVSKTNCLSMIGYKKQFNLKRNK